MGTLLIVVLLVLGLLLAVSVALGRQSQEVESARDTEYLELDGTWIRYSVIGGGPPVLLIHGWLSSSRIWEGLAGRLAQRFTVYSLDLTGFGESDKPLSGYGVRNGSRLLYSFCAHFGLVRTSVVAHDLGGNMAVKLAADHPDVVGRLILVSVPANEEQIDLPTPLWLATLPILGPLFYALGKALRPLRVMWMKPFVSDPDDLTEDILEDAAQSTPAAVQKSLSTTRREISGGRLARQARILKVPILLIAGEEDQIVDPQAVSTWADIADSAEIALIEECGHLPMLERTSEFNANVLAFLTGDARYLDLIERPPAREDALEDDDPASEGEYDDDREADEEVASNYDEPVVRRGYDDRGEYDEPSFEERGDDEHESRSQGHGSTFDPQQDVDKDETQDLTPSEEDKPNVVRKRHGRYSPRGEEEQDGEEGTSFENRNSGNGSERRDRRESAERKPPSGDDLIPEVPSDLFDWPGGWEDFRPSERRRGRTSDERPPDEGDGDDGAPPDERHP